MVTHHRLSHTSSEHAEVCTVGLELTHMLSVKTAAASARSSEPQVHHRPPALNVCAALRVLLSCSIAVSKVTFFNSRLSLQADNSRPDGCG